MDRDRGKSIELFIRGVPYSRSKSKGKLKAPEIWTQAIIEQTAHLIHVSGACELDVDFVLPEDKFPTDLPFGMDLDNLLKRLLDALGKTVLRDAPGRDSAIVTLYARKRRTKEGEQPGAHVVLRTQPKAWD